MGTIDIERRGAVLLGTLDNPPHATMDRGTVAALDALVGRAEQEDDVRAVVLTGSHPERFVAHYDVGEILDGVKASPAVGRRVAAASLRTVRAISRVPGAKDRLASSPAVGLVEIERFHDVFLRMNRCGAVFVAAINGSTQGGGCELSLACDLRIMASGDHVIGQPEILLGFPPGGGGTQRLTRLLGTGRALRLCLDGRGISPNEALDLGLVDELAEPAAVVDRALAEATRLGARPKSAIAATKRSIYFGGSLSFESGLLLERSEFMAEAGRPAAHRAMQAYVDATERDGELPAYGAEGMSAADEAGIFGG